MENVFDFIGIILGFVILAHHTLTISALIDRLAEVEKAVKIIRNELKGGEE